jgi:type IV pilus assembly protein PilY1
MAQCNTLTPAQFLIANNGNSMIDFLSGKATNEGTAFRDRSEQDQATGAFVQTVLGDIINAQPVAVGAPFFQYENEDLHPQPPKAYADFRTANANRTAFVLVGANDGFLHAFDQANGDENWAYVPRFLLPSLYQLADSGYPGQHRFYVDGSPEVADVFDTTASQWKTIVVGGLNSGGRGFYALDITDPAAPKGLWEFCSDSTWCPTDPAGNLHSDPDLGFSYGNPVIGRRDSDGRWVVVVTSGLNNVNPGDGKGYFYILDAITGQILHKVGTGVGDTTTPSGLMKIGGYYPKGLFDPSFTHVFGGDQQGNVWRVDVSKFPTDKLGAGSVMVAYTGPAATTTGMPFVGRLATLKDPTGRIQPITARPAGTHIGPIRIYYVGTGRYIGNSDLIDQGPGGIAWQQSIYGIRDQMDDSPIYGGGFTAPASFRTGTTGSSVVRQTLSQSGADRTISKNFVDWKTQDGFFIDLNPTFALDPATGNSPGERVFLDVRLIFGTLIVTSNIPAAGGACVAGGESFQYGLDFRTGGYVGNDATVGAGAHISQFLVGAAIEQTSDGLIKALNKTITGQNMTTPVPIDVSFRGKRFSYRER